MRRAMHARFAVAVIAVVLTCTAGWVSTPSPANAAQPGLNGLIAWDRNGHVWTMRSDGTGKTDLGSGSDPAWSPDGSRILYMDGTGLGTMNADGSNKTHLLDGLWTSPAWSPDGTKIALARYVDAFYGYDIFVADANGSNVIDITNASGHDSEPTWSPDGSKLAFWTARNSVYEIWTMEPNGANPTDLMSGQFGDEGYTPDWSPDGTRIAYGHDGIWVMNANGSNKTQVTSQGSDGQPAWSPDGSKIVFNSNRDYNEELYVAASDGTGQKRLTNDPGVPDPPGANDDLRAAWQPRPYLLSPTSVAFGNAVVGTETAAKTVTFKAGPTAVSITSAALAGDSPAAFEMTGDTCSGTVVAALATCTIAVRFMPLAAQPASAHLDLSGPAPLGTASVALSGTGHLFTWGTTHAAGPAYTWNTGDSLAGTVSGSTTYLHATYTTDRVGGTWVTDNGPHAGVYYIRSSNGGSTWTTPTRLNPTTQHGSRGTVASSGSYVYATWVSTTRWVKYSGTAPRALYFRRNSDHGRSTKWGSIVRLTSTTGRVDYPVLAASGSYVYVAWTDSSNGNIKLARSSNRGGTWKTMTIGTTSKSSTSGRNGFPEVSASGSTVAVTWVADSANTAKVRISTSSGVSWGTTVGLGATTYVPDVSAVGGRVGVAWVSGGIKVRIASAGVWGGVRSLPVTDGISSEHQAGPAIALFGTSSVGIAYTSTDAVPVGSAGTASSAPRSGSTGPGAPRTLEPTAPSTPGVHAAETVPATSLIWRESTDNGVTWAVSDVLGAPTTNRPVNDSPSVYWPRATRPYLLWSGWRPTTTSYRLYVRAGV